MSRVGLAKVAVFTPFVSFLAAGGSPLERHLKSFGINPLRLADPNSLVPLHWACEFVEGLSRKEGICEIGFKVGSRSPITDMGPLGGILAQSLTLKDLLEKMLVWVPHFDSGARIWIETGSSSDQLRLCLKHEAGVGRPNADAFALMILIDAVRLALGPEWRPRHFWIDPAAGNPRHYEALDTGSSHMNRSHMAFEIPKARLGAAIRPRKAAASPGENKLQSTAPEDNLVGSLTQTIESSLGSKVPVIEEAAALSGMSPRSLQRALRLQNLGYRDLVDRVRFRHAKAMLSDPAIPINEISRHLGYQSATNFTHAFRRWTSESPSSFRKQSQA